MSFYDFKDFVSDGFDPILPFVVVLLGTLVKRKTVPCQLQKMATKSQLMYWFLLLIVVVLATKSFLVKEGGWGILYAVAFTFYFGGIFNNQGQISIILLLVLFFILTTLTIWKDWEIEKSKTEPPLQSRYDRIKILENVVSWGKAVFFLISIIGAFFYYFEQKRNEGDKFTRRKFFFGVTGNCDFTKKSSKRNNIPVAERATKEDISDMTNKRIKEIVQQVLLDNGLDVDL